MTLICWKNESVLSCLTCLYNFHVSLSCPLSCRVSLVMSLLSCLSCNVSLLSSVSLVMCLSCHVSLLSSIISLVIFLLCNVSFVRQSIIQFNTRCNLLFVWKLGWVRSDGTTPEIRPKSRWKGYNFRCVLNIEVLLESLMSEGRVFQIVRAVT